MKWLLFCLGFLLTSGAISVAAIDNSEGEPHLTLRFQDRTIKYTQAELLKRKDLRKVQVGDDPAYPKQTVDYMAIPVANLFENLDIPPEAVVLFKCSDGFSAPLPRDKLLNRSKDKAIAYLAIEEPKKKWPPLHLGSPSRALYNQTAGPFYIIWTNPKASEIFREQWPFQVVSFEIKPSLKGTFPLIFPEEGLAENHGVMKGFQAFKKACISCHTMNLQGESKFGPDLNIPMNPTEYFTPHALKAFIRNPSSVRIWPEMKMKGFSEDYLSDKEVDQLVEYLKHMSKRKSKK